MGQSIILSLTEPFPDNSLCKGAKHEGTWHLTQAANYFQKAESEPDDACYYNFWGVAHTITAIPYDIPLINCLIYTINYLAYAIFSPECMQISQKEALNTGNLDGAYLMHQRGLDRSITNDQGETLVDLYAQDPTADERTYSLINENAPFNPQSNAIKRLFKKATLEKRNDIAIKLLEKGVPLILSKVETIAGPPSSSIVPQKLATFIKETGKPCIGRTKERQKVECFILKKYRQYPLLIGPPGIGKTAFANSLYEKLHVISVKLFLLQDADKNLMTSFFDFVFKRPNIFLLFDDLNLEEVNESFLIEILDRLQEKKVFYIGCAQSNIELTKYFTPIEIEAPTDEEVKQIAQKAFPNIDEATITTAMKLCKKHRPNKTQPQCILEVLDQACVKVEAQRKLAHGSFRRQQGDEVDAQEKLEDQIKRYQEISSFLREIEMPSNHPIFMRKQKKLDSLLAELERSGENRAYLEKVTPELIEHIIKPYVPPPDIKAFFKERIFGQDHMIERIIPAIYNATHGLTSPDRAQGGFLFVGLTGTGKTEMGKAIAEYLNVNFVHIDMSKYRERHDVSTLVGAGAGWIGYDQGGLIQNEAKKGPMVLLLDEVEKAHHSVFQKLLMHLLDEGQMLDPLSRQNIKMNRVFVILASNLGSKAIMDEMNSNESLNPDSVLSIVQPSIEDFFKEQHALIARLQIVPFLPIIGKEHIQKITEKFLLKEKKFTLEIHRVTLEWTPNYVPSFTSSINPKLGARVIRNKIEQDLRHQIAEACKNSEITSLSLDTLRDSEIL